MAEQKPVKFHQQNLINKTYNKKVGKLCTINRCYSSHYAQSLKTLIQLSVGAVLCYYKQNSTPVEKDNLKC